MLACRFQKVGFNRGCHLKEGPIRRRAILHNGLASNSHEQLTTKRTILIRARVWRNESLLKVLTFQKTSS